MATPLESAAAFLAGPGHRVAARALARHGLPVHLADDVVQEALLRLVRALDRGEQVGNLEAFATRLAQRAAQDLARGERRRPEGHAVAEPVEEVGAVATLAAADDLPEAAVLGAAARAALRSRVVAALAATPRPAAGALAVLAILLDGAGPATDCPAPKAGAGDAEAVQWAGLFYAGRRGCFPADGAPDDPATRKRRSRAVAEQRAVLAAALEGPR